MNERLQDIEARLTGIAPGQWQGQTFPNGGGRVVIDASRYICLMPGADHDEYASANTQFIAQAPDDMRYLLDLVRRLTMPTKVTAKAAADGELWKTGRLILWHQNRAHIVHAVRAQAGLLGGATHLVFIQADRAFMSVHADALLDYYEGVESEKS